MAIKVLRPELAAPVLRERFQREAEAAAGLRHPGHCPIFDIGGGGDLAWFVMPLVRGETLRDRLAREGRLPIGEARRIMVDTALALSVAHGAGIVHRDIKPDNILLEGEEHCVVLTDFGIAKSLGHAPGGTSLTTTGLVIGTPDYMSPEQAGGGANLDVRSDIYSLGVVTYQMLTGERPFSGHTPGAILMQQLRGPAPEPLRSRRPDTPLLLAAAIERCLHLEPADRWSSAEDLIATLTGAAPPPRTAQSPGLDPRPRARRIVAAMGLLLLPAVAVDVARGTAMLSPLLLLLTLGVSAAQYGALTMRGYGWQELIPRWAGRQTAPAADRLPEAMLAEAQGDRAVNSSVSSPGCLGRSGNSWETRFRPSTGSWRRSSGRAAGRELRVPPWTSCGGCGSRWNGCMGRAWLPSLRRSQHWWSQSGRESGGRS